MDVQVASGLAPLSLIPFIQFGGFFINQDSTPVYFKWIQEISFIRYGLEIITANGEFQTYEYSIYS